MQMLPVSEDTKLVDLTRTVGSTNVSSLLVKNGVTRTVNVGQALHDKCEQIAQNTNISVTNQRKVTMLNKLRSDSDLFETAALMSEADWRVFDTTGAFTDTLLIPEDMQIVDKSTVIGNRQQMSNYIANEAVAQMGTYGHVEPAIFHSYSIIPDANTGYTPTSSASTVFESFHIPWGEVSLHSSLSGEYQDFPVYPEELNDKISATYDTMPDMLYQYEPWEVYKSSGPRENSYKFDFHRDMWTGDHRDGYARKLINFCKANCYPRYNGSLVHTSFVTLYVGGHSIIHGILTEVSDDWDGPIGLDNRPLHCILTLTIREVSKEPLNYDYVKNMI